MQLLKSPTNRLPMNLRKGSMWCNQTALVPHQSIEKRVRVFETHVSHLQIRTECIEIDNIHYGMLLHIEGGTWRKITVPCLEFFHYGCHLVMSDFWATLWSAFHQVYLSQWNVICAAATFGSVQMKCSQCNFIHLCEVMISKRSKH